MIKVNIKTNVQTTFEAYGISEERSEEMHRIFQEFYDNPSLQTDSKSGNVKILLDMVKPVNAEELLFFGIQVGHLMAHHEEEEHVQEAMETLQTVLAPKFGKRHES